MEVVPVTDQHQVETEPQFLSLSPAALLGSFSPRALRITGFIEGHPVTALIDCGCTHNIVQPHITTFLKLPTKPISTFSVMVGNGSHIYYNGYCPDVQLHLRSTNFTIPFFILPVAGADVVLGLQWLGSLGSITTHFSTPQITFKHHDQTITLEGEPLASPATASSIYHFLQKQSVASMHSLLFEPHQT